VEAGEPLRGEESKKAFDKRRKVQVRERAASLAARERF
jgi:hypothetical protein